MIARDVILKGVALFLTICYCQLGCAAAQIPPPLGLTVPQALKKYGASARKQLREECAEAGISYPPKRLTIVGLKDEKLLLLFGGNESVKLIHSFPLVSFSGVLGPKLKEGDLQIPEGIYRVTGLAASFRLTLKLNYPNEMDRKNAAVDGRTKLGGDILVHGGSVSTGCLVISMDDMQQVFVAVNDVGISNTKVIIAPCDLTKREAPVDMKTQPQWLPALYKAIKSEMPKNCLDSNLNP